MCVIIHKPADVELSEADIRAAHARNGDGFGYMYYDKDIGRIRAQKSTKWSIDKILEIFGKQKHLDVCYHFRIKTHGEVVDQQAHPFKILEKERRDAEGNIIPKDGIDAFFMHNGVISNAGIVNEESDTQAFNWNFLQPIFKGNPKLIESEHIKKMVEEFIGRGSKLCLMYADGKVIKFNESAGSQYKGCWVSNTHSFYTSQTSNFHRGNNHTGGVTGMVGANTKAGTKTVQQFATGENGSCVPCSVGPVVHKETLLCKDKYHLGVGDEVFVFNYADDTFSSFGKITAIRGASFEIRFTGPTNIVQTCMFFASTCNGFFANGKNQYYFLSEKEWEDSVADDTPNLTVKEVREASTSTGSNLKKSLQEEQTDESTATEGETPLEEASKMSNVVSMPSTTLLEEVYEAVDDRPSDEEYVSIPVEFTFDKDLMIANDYKVTVDASNHFGGAFIEDSLEPYNEYTIRDYYLASYEDRFKMFMGDLEASFAMLNDLSEFMCIQEDEEIFAEEAETNMYENYSKYTH